MARRDRSLVRASDLAAWTYCHRAWWLAHVRRAPHERPEQLFRGQDQHREHGRSVQSAHRLQWAGRILLLAGGLLLAIAALARLGG